MGYAILDQFVVLLCGGLFTRVVAKPLGECAVGLFARDLSVFRLTYYEAMHYTVSNTCTVF